MEEVVA